MSLIKKVIKAFSKIFKVTFKTSRKSKKTSSKQKRKSPVKKSSASLKSAGPSIKKASPKKSIKKSKIIQKKVVPVLKKSKAKSSQSKKSSTTNVVGEVTHYFNKIKVCVIRIDRGTIIKGDRLVIEGKNGSLTQTVNSMQIENEDVDSARKGQLIGLRVSQEVYVGDKVQK